VHGRPVIGASGPRAQRAVARRGRADAPRSSSLGLRSGHHVTGLRPETSASKLPPAARSHGAGSTNIYSADAAGDLSAAVHGPALVYVPNSMSNTVDEISQRTMKIVREFPTGALPQHVTPAYDSKRSMSTMTRQQPDTDRPAYGRPGDRFPSRTLQPYFTPTAVCHRRAERLQRLDFRNPRTMKLGVLAVGSGLPGRGSHGLLPVTLRLRSCEFSGRMIEVDTWTPARDPHPGARQRSHSPGRQAFTGRAHALRRRPDEQRLWEIDPKRFRVIGFLHTGAGAHGSTPAATPG